jgi:preprotein translocase subunit SecG
MALSKTLMGNLATTLFAVLFALLWVYLGNKYSKDIPGGSSYGFDTSGDMPGLLKTFNWHPFLMVVGFGLFMSNGILAFSGMGLDHQTAKMVHAGCHVIGFILITIGMAVIKNFNDKASDGRFVWTHAYLGMVTFVALCVQLAAGLFVYLLPFASANIREKMMPVHKFTGICILLAGAGSIVSGMAVHQTFVPGTMSPSNNAYVLGGIMSLLMYASCFIVLSIFLRFIPSNKDEPESASAYQTM